MIAYKFLRAGRVSPFTKFPWPDPGVWVRAGAAADPCRRGIHGCRPRDLPWWIDDELWEIEVDGTPQTHEHKIVAPAATLRSRINAWTANAAQEYGQACAWRTRDTIRDALSTAGHRQAAAELAQCATLEEVVETAGRLAGDLPDARISLTITGDGARRALCGPAPAAAYIAAHAALRVHGPRDYEAERARQSSWLIARLGLDAATA